MTEPRVIEGFSDYVCPWCYLGSARVARLQKEHGVQVKFVHFPLHPETPQEGKSLEALFAGRGYDIPKMQAQMRARMAAEGLPYGDRKMTFNSRLAQELASWAVSQPGGEAIHDALFRAYFVDGKNIGDGEVLIQISRQLGLDEREAREVIEKRTHKERSTPTGRSRGNTASPGCRPTWSATAGWSARSPTRRSKSS